MGFIYLVTIMVNELTTPFINQRWFFEQAKAKDTIWYTANGIMMWVSWAVIRMGYVVWVLWVNITHWSDLVNVPVFPKFAIWFQTGIFIFLNTYWFYKITQGIIKALTGGNKSDKKK